MIDDVDHFKQFNDAAGHLEGDRGLTVVARAIAEHIRHGQDIAARFGGEEFVLLMPTTNADTAQATAERAHTATAALRVSHPGLICRGIVSVSIGVAAVSPDETGAMPAALLRAANQACHRVSAKAVPLQPYALSHNLPNFLRYCATIRVRSRES